MAVIEFRPARRWPAGRPVGRKTLWVPTPLVAIVAIAAVLWATAEFRPRNSVSGSGVFAQCVQAGQQNCVLDGDTIRHGGATIRLVGIDAPEIFSPLCAAELEQGLRARQRLIELLNEGPFEIVGSGRDEDVYGRKLRKIERGGRSLGDALVSEGLARRDGYRRGWCA